MESLLNISLSFPDVENHTHYHTVTTEDGKVHHTFRNRDGDKDRTMWSYDDPTPPLRLMAENIKESFGPVEAGQRWFVAEDGPNRWYAGHLFNLCVEAGTAPRWHLEAVRLRDSETLRSEYTERTPSGKLVVFESLPGTEQAEVTVRPPDDRETFDLLASYIQKDDARVYPPEGTHLLPQKETA